jgi:hypothetical protein
MRAMAIVNLLPGAAGSLSTKDDLLCRGLRAACLIILCLAMLVRARMSWPG